MSNTINGPLYPKPALTTAGAAVADQRLTVDATAGGLTFTAYDTNSIDIVVIDVQTADVMVTFDGSAPTSTNGHRLYAGRDATWATATFNAAKFIRATGTSGVVHATPFQI